MTSLRRTLPPVNSLVIFEAAARHLNFTHAANEMGMTQAAVSRQIQTLEADLGVPLFVRQARGIQLTKQGDRLRHAVTMGLEYIANTSADIRRRQRRPRELTVATSVSFASYWLVARLAKFRVQHPQIDLRLLASGQVSDLMHSGVDVAIRYGFGHWLGMAAERMFGNEVWPVCSPGYLAAHPRPKAPADLLGHALLHLGSFDRNWVTWESFFQSMGLADPPPNKGISFDNYLVLLQAALRGEGIALCGQRLAEDFIARGDLVRPINVALTSEKAFYLSIRRKPTSANRRRCSAAGSARRWPAKAACPIWPPMATADCSPKHAKSFRIAAER
ncbi:LysR substrate-binding domain-containing protein [Methylobrevis pamukkalensis]|uniref:Glycine cleavage system transcriptional activator n=1 Tax=Methylobrevis pamukkalensis TaxID=1439726 RepID=A0A1E3H2P7_9HYPH|nr:LysR substrate-binding domain-containing protein [Methylobrevis pamukkalensis]ODN70599.1 Glycine cleavage system transcriptional activator [Methylobrevis pamukkalensis]